MADQTPVQGPRQVYEKPKLQRLGLLRLMTRYSFAGDDEHGNHGGNHDHKHRGGE